ncbi:MAG: hypothetical protein QOI98_1512, partial [Solirubrobacteraceae bacterium]|nr:hypothetical protein [Solirubrobacteraceae bacterium]
LGDPASVELRAVAHAADDLRDARLRVLHDASFVDDPTRLLRLARYSARLGFAVEDHTAALADAAVAEGALQTVSGARVGAELRLLLGESDAVAALDAAAGLGLLAALHDGLVWDRQLAGRALGLLPGDGRPELVLLASCAVEVDRAELASWLNRLEFTARERDVVVAAATRSRELAAALSDGRSASRVARALRSAPAEAVALAGALGPGAAARSWLDDLRHVRLEIDGEDLLAAGVPGGPDVGRGLEAALGRKLDGELAPGRDAELAEALRAAGLPPAGRPAPGE